MASLQKIGNFVIDTGYNEADWDAVKSWGYIAKVEITASTFAPSQATDTALFRWFVAPNVLRGATHYQTGSTSFPSDSGQRRIYLDCEVSIEFILPEGYFYSVTPTAYRWQLVQAP